MVESVKKKVFVCVKCDRQTCCIEVESQDGRGNVPIYCPYRRINGEWSEDNKRSGPLVPESIEYRMRNTGQMWVVETVYDYGNDFVSKEDVKYFYSQQRALNEYKRRREEGDL